MSALVPLYNDFRLWKGKEEYLIGTEKQPEENIKFDPNLSNAFLWDILQIKVVNNFILH